MKQVIYKYELGFQDEIRIKVNQGSRILFVEKQHGVPHVWMICEPGDLMEVRDFIKLATGQETDTRGMVYVGSIMTNQETLVWHYFEKIMPV